MLRTLTTNRMLLAAAVVLAAASPAAAQQTAEQEANALVSDDQPAEQVTDEGLKWKLAPSLSFSFNDNRSVVGQPDGWAMTLDAHLPVDLGYRTGPHEIRGTFDAQAAFARSAALSEFTKSKDHFGVSGDYLFHALEWFGPYVHFALDTAMFEGYDTRANDTTWHIAYRDGTTQDYGGRHLLVTDPFQPLTIRESAGAFAEAYKSDPFTLEVRVGFGGIHTMAAGQLVVNDDAGTPEVEVKELYSFDQAAVELGVAMTGAFVEKKVTYDVGAVVAVPVVNRPENPDFTLGELTNVDLHAILSFKLLSWLSLDYTFKAIRQPQLVDAFQIQNNLLLTLSYTWSNETAASE